MQISVGQKWSIKNLKDSYCIINMIENDIIHISVHTPNFEIMHMPFDKKIFSKSILKLISHKIILKKNLKAIDIWRVENGGVYSISISKAVKL